MMRCSLRAQRQFTPEERPWLISRSGMPGMQRYAQTWSGDNYTEWRTIRFNLRMGLGLSLSGLYNLGHDVGGFAGPAPEPELLVRWVPTYLLTYLPTYLLTYLLTYLGTMGAVRNLLPALHDPLMEYRPPRRAR